MKFHVHRASRISHRPRGEATQATPHIEPTEPARVPHEPGGTSPVIDLREEERNAPT
jgi:hypothetical protein